MLFNGLTRNSDFDMVTYEATIKEKCGAVLHPTYMASEDFWKWNEPIPFLKKFCGLDNPDVESWSIKKIEN